MVTIGVCCIVFRGSHGVIRDGGDMVVRLDVCMRSLDEHQALSSVKSQIPRDFLLSVIGGVIWFISK